MASSPSGIIVPGLPPPPGVTSNFVDPYNQSSITVAIVATLLPLATAFVSIRMYTKICLIKSHGWDDYTSFIAWLALIVYSAVNVKLTDSGSGVHQWDLPAQRLKGFAQWVNITGLAYSLTISITKLSILLMYLRIFTPERSIRAHTYHLTWFIIWFNMLFYLSVMMAIGFQCIPRQKIWQPSVPGKCINAHALETVTAIINILSDFSILLLPVQSVWRLQLAPKRKLAISSVFATGLVACVASIVRAEIGLKNYHNQDFTYRSGSAAHWCYAEIVIGVICGCMPVLPKFFRHVIPKISQILSYYRSIVRDFSRQFTSLSTSQPSYDKSSTTLPQDSVDGPAITQGKNNKKGFLTLRSLGNNSLGLSTLIRAGSPRIGTATSTFALGEKGRRETGDSQDAESWKGIIKTTQLETSIASRTDSQEVDDILHHP